MIITEEEKNKVIRLYKDGNSAYAIADITGFTYCSVLKLLKDIGLYDGRRKNKIWTEEEKDTLKKYYENSDWDNLLSLFPQKTKQQIYSMGCLLGLKRKNVGYALYSKKEDDIILKYYNDYGAKYIKDNFLPFRTESSIQSRAGLIGATKNRAWTKEEEEILATYYPLMRVDEVVKMLDRTRDSVIDHAVKLGITNVLINNYTEDDLNFIRNNYLTMSDKEMSEHLNRSEYSVHNKRVQLKLRRPNSYPFNDICDFCRAHNYSWKIDSMRACGYKCAISGERFNDIHHLYGLNLIVRETCDELGIDYNYDINKDEQNLSQKILDKFYQIQAKYPLGVCLKKDIHKAFHNQYGYGYNTPEQFKEFVKTYKS